MPNPASLWGGNLLMSSPINRTMPLLIGTRPEITLSKVVFPAPFAPKTATTSPVWVSSETPFKASTAPYATTRFSTDSSVSMLLLLS